MLLILTPNRLLAAGSQAKLIPNRSPLGSFWQAVDTGFQVV